jgi:FAD-linked sulfhydryl oxidase
MYRGGGRKNEEDCDFCPDSQKMVEQMKLKAQQTVEVEQQAPSPAEVGQATWTFLHVFAASYPQSPSGETQYQAMNLLRSLSTLYPCRYCAQDWEEQITLHPPQVSSRHELEQWMCQQHNHVNVKLGKKEFDCSKVHDRWAKKRQ